MDVYFKIAESTLTLFKEIGEPELQDWVLYQMFMHNPKIFARAAAQYAKALQEITDDRNDVITDLGYSLAMFVEFEPDYTSGEEAEKVQSKAKKALMRTSLFRGTQFEAKLIQSLEENEK